MNNSLSRALVFCAGLFFAGWAGADTPFTDLVDMHGNDVTTEASTGQGKWTVVMIWATDCHVCKQQKPMISAFHDKHKDSLATVYGLALDGRSGLPLVRKYMKDHEVTFPTYVGEMVVLATQYEKVARESLRGTPTYLLFNPEGELLGVNPGPISDGAIERFIERNS